MRTEETPWSWNVFDTNTQVTIFKLGSVSPTLGGTRVEGPGGAEGRRGLVMVAIISAGQMIMISYDPHGHDLWRLIAAGMKEQRKQRRPRCRGCSVFSTSRDYARGCGCRWKKT
jgi:hypothetical protein